MPRSSQSAKPGHDTALECYLEDLVVSLRGSKVMGEIPELARLHDVRPDHVGIAICTVDGELTAGGTDHCFTIQSISKAFAYGAAIDCNGLGTVLRKVDVEPSGEEFSALSIDGELGIPKNPMVNVGALVTHSMLGDSAEERWEKLNGVLNKAAGRELEVHEPTFEEELAMSDRNRALAYMLRSTGALEGAVEDVLEGYLRGCAVLVSAADLATMAATIANGGVNPCTGERIFAHLTARQIMSVMLTCGMYDSAGDWATEVGIPAKSGVGGGIMASLPGRAGIATYAPHLDRHGNSALGQVAFEKLSDDYRLHLLDGAGTPSFEARAEKHVEADDVLGNAVTSSAGAGSE